MHSHRRSRGKILFEALCAFGLAASFAGASDQTGASALLASASIMGLVAIYWSFGLFARDRAIKPSSRARPSRPLHRSNSRARSLRPLRRCEVETLRLEEVFARDAEEAFACEPEVAAEPKPVAKAPKKPRARKVKKTAAVAAPIVEQAEPAASADSAPKDLPLEPLFEPQPFARQPRAFGRKSRVRGPLSAA